MKELIIFFSSIILIASCQNSDCGNGVQDGNETGIDCGGNCTPCGPLSGKIDKILYDSYDLVDTASRVYEFKYTNNELDSVIVLKADTIYRVYQFDNNILNSVYGPNNSYYRVEYMHGSTIDSSVQYLPYYLAYYYSYIGDTIFITNTNISQGIPEYKWYPISQSQWRVEYDDRHRILSYNFAKASYPLRLLNGIPSYSYPYDLISTEIYNNNVLTVVENYTMNYDPSGRIIYYEKPNEYNAVFIYH